jgi:hypothetical protein
MLPASQQLAGGAYPLSLQWAIDGAPVSIRLGEVRVSRRSDLPRSDGQGETHARFGAEIELVGHDIAPAELLPGGRLDLTLYWRAARPMSTSYTVFVHFLDADGRKRAQHDSVPVSGAYPTTAWLPSEHVADRYTLYLPHDLPPGDYTIVIGLYDPTRAIRLPLHSPAGESLNADSLLVTTVPVSR